MKNNYFKYDPIDPNYNAMSPWNVHPASRNKKILIYLMILSMISSGYSGLLGRKLAPTIPTNTMPVTDTSTDLVDSTEEEYIYDEKSGLYVRKLYKTRIVEFKETPKVKSKEAK